MNQQEITDDDKAILSDMNEKFEYFMRKYEGSCLNLITSIFYMDGQIRMAPRLELGRIHKQQVIHKP